ncbi:DUF565 domain-containing protein [Prochlorococcus marinus]|uniref:DUF565 domain-containing protein n=1 Tax=Prochlorococcus marinus TaxID=1219 RepID=UPI002FBEB12B
MQNTKFSKLIYTLVRTVNPIISYSWRERSIILLSLLTGFYLTNSLLSFLLDKSVNTIYLAILIVVIMELSIRSLIFSKSSLIIISINNFRIGSTYALILEAYKLGS